MHIQPLFIKLFRESTGLNAVSIYIDNKIDYVALFVHKGCAYIYYMPASTTIINSQELLLSSFNVDGYNGYGEAEKPDAFVSRHLNGVCADYKLKLIDAINVHFGLVNTDDEVIIWPPNKIPYAYLDVNYWQGSGSIGNSCMRHKENQKALNFYTKNNVRIAVIITKDNKVKARALLWENVLRPDRVKPVTYLDRVYYSLGAHVSSYDKFVIDNKFLSYTKCSTPLYITDIDLKDISYLPYADTFRTLYFKDKILTTDEFKPKGIKHPDYKVRLSQAGNNGYFRELDPNAVREALTGSYISKKDAVRVKRYEGFVAKDNIVVIDTAYYSKHDRNIFRLKDGVYCLECNVIKEALTHNSIDKTQAVYVPKYKGYISKENIITLKKEQYHIDDEKITCFEGEYYLKITCYHVTETDTYIPKLKALIVYDLTMDDSGNITFDKEKYIPDTHEYYQLASGEGIRNTRENKACLIRRSKKLYLKTEYKFKDKKQLLLWS